MSPQLPTHDFEEILITPQNLALASQARVVNLTERERPVFLD
jgi:hypothetical protein